MKKRVMVILAMLWASAASADPRLSRDDLMTLVDPTSSVVVRPKSDHGIDMLASATEHHHDRLWRAIDVTTLILSTAALACDAGQTYHSAADRWHGGTLVEANPIMGPSPSTRMVLGYFAIVTLVNAAVWVAMPNRYKSIIPAAIVGVQVKTIAGNVETTRTVCGVSTG